MNGFNTGLDEMMKDIFMGLHVTSEEEKAMREHYERSDYSRLHILRARRDEDKVLSVLYDDGKWIRYKVQ